MLHTIRIFIAIVILIPIICVAESKVIDPTSKKGIEITEAARPEIAKQKYDLKKSRISIFEERDSYVVSVVDKDAKISPTQYGSPPGHPMFEVVLRKEDLKILRSAFAK